MGEYIRNGKGPSIILCNSVRSWQIGRYQIKSIYQNITQERGVRNRIERQRHYLFSSSYERLGVTRLFNPTVRIKFSGLIPGSVRKCNEVEVMRLDETKYGGEGRES